MVGVRKLWLGLKVVALFHTQLQTGWSTIDLNGPIKRDKRISHPEEEHLINAISVYGPTQRTTASRRSRERGRKSSDQ